MEHAASAATTVADEIRQEILAGHLPPGTRLDEVSLGVAHGVSRNTLREAFRLLAHDRLVEHRPHRGVFVRTIDSEEAHEIYAVRRMVEVGALRELAAHGSIPSSTGIARMADAVGTAERAREAGDWATVGTMNSEFHLALTALAGNRVVDRLMTILVTEIRLFFLTAGTPDEVHDRYLDENHRILVIVRAGELSRAAVALETYLLDAERHLVGR